MCRALKQLFTALNVSRQPKLPGYLKKASGMKDRVPNKQKENSYFQKTFYARR
jgi:hypothetical protein